MGNRLSGKVALITGSTQGLGEGIARRFAREGARVVVHGRSRERGQRVVDQLQALGAEAMLVTGDVGDKNACQAVVAQATERFGALDILINNAQSIPELLDSGHDIDGYLASTLDSGLYASLWMAQAALPWFQCGGGGRIVNFASINGVFGSKFGTPYNATKEAIRGLTRTLANEWGRYNVTVNAVMPSGLSAGYVAFYEGDPAKFDAVARINPMRRHGLAEDDIGSAVLGLVEPSSAYITGQSLFVDGGSNLMGLPQLHQLDDAGQGG